jgi:hypothetical protein
MKARTRSARLPGSRGVAGSAPAASNRAIEAAISTSTGGSGTPYARPARKPATVSSAARTAPPGATSLDPRQVGAPVSRGPARDDLLDVALPEALLSGSPLRRTRQSKLHRPQQRATPQKPEGGAPTHIRVRLDLPKDRLGDLSPQRRSLESLQDSEPRIEAGGRCELPQGPRAEAVKGADPSPVEALVTPGEVSDDARQPTPHAGDGRQLPAPVPELAHGLAQLTTDPCPHLGRGAIGEREHQQRLGTHRGARAGLPGEGAEDPQRPPRQRPGLARARSRRHDDVPVDVQRGALLVAEARSTRQRAAVGIDFVDPRHAGSGSETATGAGSNARPSARRARSALRRWSTRHARRYGQRSQRACTGPARVGGNTPSAIHRP